MNDDTKRHVIHILLESMREKGKKKAKTEKRQVELSAEDYIDSLIVKGGEPISGDVNDISSFIEEKYMQ
jgi:hypothetical protein